LPRPLLSTSKSPCFLKSYSPFLAVTAVVFTADLYCGSKMPTRKPQKACSFCVLGKYNGKAI